MGKNYRKELDNLNAIYDNAARTDVGVLANFVKEHMAEPFIGVGSGGSYSVACVMNYLCRKAGILSTCATPLEFCDLSFAARTAAVMLFTAGGSNNDSRNAYQYLSMLEPKALLTCCMRQNAPIKKMQHNNLHEFYYEYRMPVAKDGFLAVESYFSSTVLLARAFEQATGDAFFSLSSMPTWDKGMFDYDLLREVLRRESIIVLHGGIATPAAIDLESKFSEVSLGNINLTDFRNFAHGRHYWVSDRRNSTSIIALVGANEKKLADKTLALLPRDIPVLREDISDDTIDGLIHAICYVLELVWEAGNIKGIDPGHPKVEEFGRKLYHINYNICNTPIMKTLEKDNVSAGLCRKVNKPLSQIDESLYKYACEKYKHITTREFRGIIFDYDGTLHDKRRNSELEEDIFGILNSLLREEIVVGIATGRGKSVRVELQKVIEQKYWDKVVIAYYNGGTIGTLDDAAQPDKSRMPFPEEFCVVQKYVEGWDCGLQVDGIEDRNPYQLTVMSVGKGDLDSLRIFIENNTQLKILQSSHSVDIIPRSSSKNNILKWFEERGMDSQDFLLMGDSGHEGGNDYELLSNPYGLSVDTVHKAMDSCWNFASMGKRNLEATKEYLDRIEVQGPGRFKLKG